MQLPINIYKQLNKVALIIKNMHVHMNTVLPISCDKKF